MVAHTKTTAKVPMRRYAGWVSNSQATVLCFLFYWCNNYGNSCTSSHQENNPMQHLLIGFPSNDTDTLMVYLSDPTNNIWLSYAGLPNTL